MTRTNINKDTNMSGKNYDEYKIVFGDLCDLAAEDLGERTRFADDVLGREVHAGLKDWIKSKFTDEVKHLLTTTGQKFRQNESIIRSIEDLNVGGNYAKVMAKPGIFSKFSDDIASGAEVAMMSTKLGRDVMSSPKEKAESIARIQSVVQKKLNKKDFTTSNDYIRVDFEIPIKGTQETIKGSVNLNKDIVDRHVDALKAQQPALQKIIHDADKSMSQRPSGKTKMIGGKPHVWNGTKWILYAGGAAALWQNKDQLPGAIQAITSPNPAPNYTNPDSESKSTTTNSENATEPSGQVYDNDANQSKYKPGNAIPQNSGQSNKNFQDAWDKLKKPSKSNRGSSEDTSKGWWNTPSSKKTSYDDMGYVGASDMSWNRTSQKQTAYDELSDNDFANNAADQIISAENLLSNYGLGDNSQPAEKIIPSLLLGNFDGMSFDEYKNTHTQEETELAMQKFKQGLEMFSNEISNVAKNLENVYNERQRRFESKQSGGISGQSQ
jgi:hypothetical protein